MTAVCWPPHWDEPSAFDALRDKLRRGLFGPTSPDRGGTSTGYSLGGHGDEGEAV